MPTKYDRIIEYIFNRHFDGSTDGFEFSRSEIQVAADMLQLGRVSNVGEVLHTTN